MEQKTNSLDKEQHIYAQLIFKKDSKQFSRKKTIFPTHSARITGCPYSKKLCISNHT